MVPPVTATPAMAGVGRTKRVELKDKGVWKMGGSDGAHLGSRGLGTELELGPFSAAQVGRGWNVYAS